MLLGCLKRSICQWKAKNKKQIEGEILSNQELKKNIQIIIILLLNLNCDFYQCHLHCKIIPCKILLSSAFSKTLCLVQRSNSFLAFRIYRARALNMFRAFLDQSPCQLRHTDSQTGTSKALVCKIIFTISPLCMLFDCILQSFYFLGICFLKMCIKHINYVFLNQDI